MSLLFLNMCIFLTERPLEPDHYNDIEGVGHAHKTGKQRPVVLISTLTTKPPDALDNTAFNEVWAKHALRTRSMVGSSRCPLSRLMQFLSRHSFRRKCAAAEVGTKSSFLLARVMRRHLQSSEGGTRCF